MARGIAHTITYHIGRISDNPLLNYRLLVGFEPIFLTYNASVPMITSVNVTDVGFTAYRLGVVVYEYGPAGVYIKFGDKIMAVRHGGSVIYCSSQEEGFAWYVDRGLIVADGFETNGIYDYTQFLQKCADL